MAIVTIAPEDAVRPHLGEGVYGSGLQNEADVEISKFEFPAETRLPGWDREGEKGPYAWASIRIVTADGQSHFVDHFLETPALKKFLLQCGVPVGEHTSDPGFDFDTETVAGRKLSGIRLGPPREYNGVTYTGKIKAILGN